MLKTPCLLPVINPNIRTVEPREMWEQYGFEALITNSYVIWKHEKLKEQAVADGVHKLLDYPGVIMTDSGTFQNYVYGDVEVGVEEIVTFQRDIGVDIATMLDVFGTPDMTKEEVEKAVQDTISRSAVSLEAAGETMLNGPIQGGIHSDLRKQSAIGMGEHEFAIHPIGGIVPLMERQRYRELVEIILACREQIPWNRPIHMFGCGHPHLFPICVALGADLFDSAAYALFARDDRMLMPWGTVKLGDLDEFPISTAALSGQTPASIRSLPDDARCKLLARHNLEVTASELARCRQAVRNGTIWKLVEERSHTNAALREATEYLYENMPEALIAATNPLRNGGVPMSLDLPTSPPAIAALGRLLNSFETDSERAILISGASGPWRNRISGLVHSIAQRWPDAAVFIETPLGLLPYTMEDVNPWAHLMGPSSIWNGMPPEDRDFDLQVLMGDIEQVVEISFENNKESNLSLIESAFGEGLSEEINRAELDREMIEDKV
ncbi:MAG: tRNA guanosine(15) transglycosylase TgtA, partial [Candidatus Poseidoniales archaeon]|nr:tRNA guanosine(15) transglycosylase TgtA [Candidatus Poseidoniales archaeon]